MTLHTKMAKSDSHLINEDIVHISSLFSCTRNGCGNSSPITFHPIFGELTFHPITFHPILRFTQITIHPTHVLPKLHLLQSFTHAHEFIAQFPIITHKLLDLFASNFYWGNQENHGNLLRLVKKF